MRFIFLLGLIFINTELVSAQSLDDFSSGQATIAPQQEILLNPELPEPREAVTARLNSNVMDGEITWLLNGVEIDNSRNLREVEFMTSQAGETDVIRALVGDQGRVLANLEKTITPRHVDIILEPQTHSPDFYLGRSLASPGSLVNATALISGITDYSNLLFRWRLDLNVLGNNRSLGRHTVSFETDISLNPVLSLEVTDLNGNRIASESVIVTNDLPYVKFYTDDTLLGLNHLPINDTWNMVGNTGVLRAVPFNLDSRVYNNPRTIEWKIDGDEYENTGPNPYEITLQKNTNSGGSSQLDFMVRDITRTLQRGRADININL